MPWDDEDRDFAYIDYLAEHESGFLGGLPIELIGTAEALRRIALATGSMYHLLHEDEEND